MPESGRRKKTPEGPAVARTRKKIAPLLREWYGDSAPEEMLKYLPEASDVGTLLTRFMKRRIPKAGLVVFTIRTKWEEIAGAVTAKRTRPFCYRDGILDIEVAHPAFLVPLRSKTIRDTILARVRAIPGAEECRELRFIPAGRLAPASGGMTGKPDTVRMDPGSADAKKETGDV